MINAVRSWIYSSISSTLMTMPLAQAKKQGRFDRLLHGILTFLFILASVPLLALNPQSGDGPELLITATAGGVLHPPGFPVQAWINRLMISLPFGTPCQRISVISLIGLAGVLWLMMEVGASLGFSRFTRCFAALFLVTSPSLWYLGVQPEVFGLTLFFITAVIWTSTRNFSTHRLSILFGIALSQHPLTLVSAPFYINRVKKWKRFIKQAALTFTVLFIFYGSLLFQNKGQVWPNWGNLHTPYDLIRHVLRLEYGAFSLSSHHGTIVFNALGILLYELLHFWGLYSLFIILSLFLIFKKKEKNSLFFKLLFIQWILALLFLARSGVTFINEYSESVLQRFICIALLPCGFMLMQGIDFSLKQAPNRKIKTVIVLALTLGFLAVLPNRILLANAAKDTTLKVFHDAVSSQLPSKGLVLARSDDEGFLGFGSAPNQVPALLPGLMGLDWYRLNTLPKLVPFLQPPAHWHLKAFGALETLMYEHHIPLISTDLRYFDPKSGKVQRTGLFFIWSSDVRSFFDSQSAQSVIRLCPYVAQLPELPLRVHWLSIALMKDFSDAFIDLAVYLQRNTQNEPAMIATRIANALASGNPNHEAAANCKILQEWNGYASP